jgi:hypothetical protein
MSVVIQIHNNPFNIFECQKIVTDENINAQKFILDYYKNKEIPVLTFKVNKTNYVIQDLDFNLNDGDTLNIYEFPQGNFKDIGIKDIAKSFVPIVGVFNTFKLIASLFIQEPEDINYNRPVGNAYNFNAQRNLSRIGEPIPSQYGKLKWFPDLATAPYQYFEDSKLVTEYLLSLGHGEHVIHQLYSGKTKILGNENVSYTQFTPNTQVTNTETLVYTVKEFNSVPFKSPARSRVSYTAINFHKTNKHITFPHSDHYLTYKFNIGDFVRIWSDENTAFNGVFEITAVTDSRLTLADTSAWTSDDETIFAVLYREGDYYENPFYSLLSSTDSDLNKNPYLVNGTATEVFTIETPYAGDVYIELDLRSLNGFYMKQNNQVYQIHKNISGYLKPAGSGYYKWVYEVDVTTTSDNYQFSLPTSDYWWGINNDISGLKFPTKSSSDNYYFTHNGTVVPTSDIDYVNSNSVRFFTQKTGTLKLHDVVAFVSSGYPRLDNNLVFKNDFYLYTPQTNTVYKTVKLNLFRYDDYEINIYPQYQVMLYVANSNHYLEDYSDDVSIDRIKIVYPKQEYFPNVDLLKVKIVTASNNPNQLDNKIGVLSERKLIKYSNGSWSNLTATRSIAWALADIWLSSYGASKHESTLDLSTLVELDNTWSSYSLYDDAFDGVFDSTITVWEALTKVARAGRARPVMIGNKLTFVRDQAQTAYEMIFTPDNMLPNSFNMEYIFFKKNDYKAYIVNYIDEENNYEPAKIYTKENAGNYKEVTLFGVTQYYQAWREAQYMQSVLENNNKLITFDTDDRGQIPSYGSVISVSHDLPDWGQSGQVVKVETINNETIITSNQPIDFSDSGTYYVRFITPFGNVTGNIAVSYEAQQYNNDPYKFKTIPSGPSVISSKTNKISTIFQIGIATNISQLCVVTKITAKGNRTYSIECMPYIPSNYTADSGTPPIRTTEEPNTLPLPQNIGGLLLTNTPNSGVVVAKWNPVNNISLYKIQKSTDNQTYTDVATTTNTTYNINATGTLYVRVASMVSSTVGNYAVSVITAS